MFYPRPEVLPSDNGAFLNTGLSEQPGVPWPWLTPSAFTGPHAPQMLRHHCLQAIPWEVEDAFTIAAFIVKAQGPGALWGQTWGQPLWLTSWSQDQGEHGIF